jgi:hypothetical protein
VPFTFTTPPDPALPNTQWVYGQLIALGGAPHVTQSAPTPRDKSLVHKGEGMVDGAGQFLAVDTRLDEHDVARFGAVDGRGNGGVVAVWLPGPIGAHGN